MSVPTGRVGIGTANDLSERNIVDKVTRLHASGLLAYLTIYIYEDYSEAFQLAMQQKLPPTMKYAWHGGGEFEVPYAGDSVAHSQERIGAVQRIWNPAWATEDMVVTNFAKTQTQGNPPFVPLFLTEECLEVCIQKTKSIQQVVAIPFVPELPHFEVPVPETMDLADFFRRYTQATGCLINLDLGHYFSYNLLHGRDPLAGLEDFPLHQVFEIHAGGGLIGDGSGRTWLDDHSAPLHPLVIEALNYVIPRCPQLGAVAADTVGCDDWVLQHNLELLNDLFWGSAKTPQS
jgi:hypothetical protein